jgi:hypothetical protein
MEQQAKKKESSWMEMMMKENPLIKAGVKEIAEIQGEQLKQGAAQKDVAGLLQDLLSTYGVRPPQESQSMAGTQQGMLQQPQQPAQQQITPEILQQMMQQQQPQQSPQQQGSSDWSTMRKLLFSLGAGLSGLSGSDATVAGLLKIAQSKMEAQQQAQKGVYGFNPMTGQISLMGNIPAKGELRTSYGGHLGQEGFGFGSSGGEEMEEGHIDQITNQFVPKGFEVVGYSRDSKTGKQVPKIKKIEKSEMEKGIEEFQVDVMKQQRIDEHNLMQIAGAAKDYMGYLTESYKQGAAGDITKKLARGLAQRGIATKRGAEKYAASATVQGKKVEFLSKLFPMLTQQLGKAGTVRFLSSVYERLEQTIPDIQLAAPISKSQIEGTVESMFRISRSMAIAFPDAESSEKIQLMAADEIKKVGPERFAKRMSEIAKTVSFSPEEQQGLKEIQAAVTYDLDQFLASDQYLGTTGRSATEIQIQRSEDTINRIEELMKSRMGQ